MNLPCGSGWLEPPGAAHGRPTLVPIVLPLTLWGPPIHDPPPVVEPGWVWGSGRQWDQGSRTLEGKQEGGTEVFANSTQKLAWNAATSRLQQETSPGSRFTWHLVTVITAEL